MKKTQLSRKPIYKGEIFRVMPIVRIIPTKLFENGIPQFDEDTFETLPISEGVGIEAKIGVDEKTGEDYYYVVAFVRWDSDRECVSYDAYLDRVARVLVENRAANYEFWTTVQAASVVVADANGGTYCEMM